MSTAAWRASSPSRTLLEELVGEIADEFDPGVRSRAQRSSPDVYDVDGRLSIHDSRHTLDIDEDDLAETEAESPVGGLISDVLGLNPDVGIGSCIRRSRSK